MQRAPVENLRYRILWNLLSGCAFVAAVGFTFSVSQRVLYPYELEWMEGAMVDHAWRVANGLSLYCAPGPEHVPFLYTPLLSWLGGLAIGLGVPGLFALRAIATLASIGAAVLIGHWVRRETGQVRLGNVAAGLFLAGYGWLAWWFDLARNDSLFVFLCLCAGFVLLHGGPRRWLPAAVFATAALLAKQSALAWLGAMFFGAVCHDWRNALRFGIATALGTVSVFGSMHLASDGWSTFFLFEMPMHHGWTPEYWLGFWTRDVSAMWGLVGLGLVALRARWGRRREALFLAAFGAGGLLTAWFSRLHVGAFVSVLMPALACCCVLAPLAASSPARWLRLGLPLVLLAQFGWFAHLAWERAPGRTLLPSPEHRRAHDELFEFVQAQQGPVWVTNHGGISARAGKGTGAHAQAMLDLLQLLPEQTDGFLDLRALFDRTRLADLSPRAQQAIACFADGTTRALRERRYAAVVIDDVGANQWPMVFFAGLLGRDGQPGTADDPYVRLDRALLTGPSALRPLVGYRVDSPYAIVPR